MVQNHTDHFETERRESNNFWDGIQITWETQQTQSDNTDAHIHITVQQMALDSHDSTTTLQQVH